VITEITLRLHPLPEKVSVAFCSFGTAQGAVETVMEAIQFGVGLARVEFLDDKQVEPSTSTQKSICPFCQHCFSSFTA
jgi:D-lactate dehydrogenase (cytochrome)